MYLFEKVENNLTEIESIVNQIDFILNSFCLNNHFNGFGINIWNLDLENLKNNLEKEEPRIEVTDISINNDFVCIYFYYKGEILNIKRDFYPGAINEFRANF